MEANGPPQQGSKNSYISNLRFLSENNFNIGRNLDTNDNIFNSMRERNVQTKTKYEDYGSALNKYRGFLNTFDELLVSDIGDINNRSDIRETEKLALITARIGQGEYRKAVINLWKKCAVSEFEKTEFLIASHILPWKLANDSERLSPYNGLLLLPNYDKMFDKGYISFNDNGSIILSSKISEKEFEQLGIRPTNRLFKVQNKTRDFLKKHREIFKEILYSND